MLTDYLRELEQVVEEGIVCAVKIIRNTVGLFCRILAATVLIVALPIVATCAVISEVLS